MPIPPRAAQSRLDVLFPMQTAAPSAGTFELGILFGGTVSAGAWSAGALDFLLEALEAWNVDPAHIVVIKSGVGTSGGAVCAAMLGILSSRVVPHITADQATLNANANATGNPLWDVWVNDFQISKLLSTGDLDLNQDVDAGTGVRPGNPPGGDGIPIQHTGSILNCQMIDEAANGLARFAETPGGVPRPYFASPFRVTVTLANIRGIPFKIEGIATYNQYTGAAFFEHDDIARFAFPNGAPLNDINKREDEFWLDSSASGRGVVGYDVLAGYATASGSMPLGLVGRTLVRPAEHYWYRPSVRAIPDAPGYEIAYVDPDWIEIPEVEQSGFYKFTAVDGGCFNNEPVSILHHDLAGLVGRNPRSSSEANRAMLMIDPLVGQPGTIEASGRSLVRVAGSVVGMFVNGARYLTADLDLFRDEDVFSRFQLVPTRPEPGRVGEAALSGSLLGALAGWGARAFRVHDYMLGRANMQSYLKSELILSADNQLFAGWTGALRATHASDINGNHVTITPATNPSTYYLPVLPDVTGRVVPIPTWPVGALNADTLHDPIVHRIEAVLRKLRADNLPGALNDILGLFVIPGVSSFLGSMLIDQLKSELQKAGL
jgi:hypothetical protein